MFRRWPILFALAVGLCLTPSADAGWVVVKNDTKQPVIVVEVGGTAAKPVQGKSVKLQPGETYREFQAAAGQKTFAVYDAAKPNAPLVQQAVAWATDDASFHIRSDGKSVKLVAADMVAKK